MLIKINLTEHHNRLLLLSAVELFLQSYGSNQLGDDIFAYHSPLTSHIYKVHHINHRYDRQTKKLLVDYQAIRRGLLDNTIDVLDTRHAVELSVQIENYIQEFTNTLDASYILQLKRIDSLLSRVWREKP